MLRGSRFQLRPLTRPAFTQASLFHTSSSYRALKEEDRRTSIQPYAGIRLHIDLQLTGYPTDRDTQEVSSEVEREKHEHLSKHKEGQAKWNNSLASSSEADVRLDLTL